VPVFCFNGDARGLDIFITLYFDAIIDIIFVCHLYFIDLVYDLDEHKKKLVKEILY